MAYDIEDTLRFIQSHLAASSRFVHTQIGEPKSPPAGGLTASVRMDGQAVSLLSLQSTIETHTVIIRIYRNMLAEPQEDAEIEVAQAVSEVEEDLIGDFDLGGTVRNIDIGGQHGAGVSARWGYVDVGGTLYRIADITLPFIVDDSASLVK